MTAQAMIPIGTHGRQTRAARMVMYVPAQTLRRIVLTSVGAALFSVPLYADLSPWIGVGIALSIFVVWHSIEASRVVPWVPGLTMAAACVQWILAPWAVYAISAKVGFGHGIGSMAVYPAEYFGYAVPATLGLVVGLFVPLFRAGRRLESNPKFVTNRRMRRTCDLMFFGGIAVRIFVTPFAPASLRFVAYLLASLATVGVCALMLDNSPRWRIYVVVAIAIEALLNTLDAQYLDVMLLIGFIAVIYVYRFRVKPRTMVMYVGLAMVGLLAINALKVVYRDALRVGRVQRDERLSTAADVAAGIAATPAQVLSETSVLYSLYRLNEGAVISQVMAWVPNREPYAKGETIADAVRSAIVPRALDPTKTVAGGFDVYTRFTGGVLVGSTSINIALAGEMYANYGRWGGVLAVFCCGIGLGWVFLILARLSRSSPYWWAWAPFLLYGTVSAEMGTMEVLNQVTKSLFVFGAFVAWVPAWSSLWRFSRRYRQSPLAHRGGL